MLCCVAVAIVTGAGNGLGRAYAEYLSALGAKVLVNDPATTTCPTTHKTVFAADQVAKALPGDAASNHNSVVEGDKVVEAAIKKCALRTWHRHTGLSVFS
jgi:multifunctional beta-oxidation protein